MKVSARALSVSCPHCHRVISLENLRIVGAHPGRSLATCGDIRIEATARLNVTIIARNVTILGRVRGPVSASEVVEVGATGCVIGDITAPKILVQDGAVINGRCQMTKPAPPKKSDGAEREVSNDEVSATASDSQSGNGSGAKKLPTPVAAAASVLPRPLRRPVAGS